jgi:hypothetical protein
MQHCGAKIFVAAQYAFVILAIDVRFVSFDSVRSSGNKSAEIFNGGSPYETETYGNGCRSIVYARQPKLCG